MRNRYLTLAACGVALAASTRAGTQDRPTATDDQLRALNATFDLVRSRSAQDYTITTSTGIDEARYLKVGGIEQWVTIRGEDRANPVVLVLHGGPGDATNPYGHAAFRSWLATFTVVQWDQRGAGKTLGRNGPGSAENLTIDRIAQDGIELAETLRTWLRKEQIILLGHSFGSVIGVLMAKAKPNLFAAYVGTGQVGDPSRSYRVAFEALLAKARASRDARAIRELEAIGPPPYKEGRPYQVQRRWSNFFEGADTFIASMLGFAVTAPGYTVRDVTDWLDGQRLSGERLVPQSSAMAANALTGRFALPVFVIQGSEDFTTPTSLAREFVDKVDAPRKAFVTIEGGHFAVFMKGSQFVKELSAILQPPPR
jgi:pimeloyl-ACP methyl ester carboxylesterase